MSPQMIKFKQGDYPIYISKRHIIAVKPDLSGSTKIVTTGQATADGAVYSAFTVNESIEDVVSAIETASSKGAD